MPTPLIEPISLRDDKGHRQATWLELFFDLAFVISIAALSAMLAADHTLEGLAIYIGLFLAVYWAWNQLTWYSALFDNNDVFFKVQYLCSILAVLGLAASIRQIAEGETWLFVISYVLLQGILAAGWIRVYISKSKLRTFALIYILGQIVGSGVWIASTAVTVSQQYYVWIIAMAVHIAAPYFAWRTKIDIAIHTHHIVERYCLLSIIVMGETLVAVSIGFGDTMGSRGFLVGVFGYVTIACVWWTYFGWDFDRDRVLETVSSIFFFGYGHFVVFLAIAAFGAGVEIAIHSVTHGGHPGLQEKMLIAFPPAIYLLSLSAMNLLSWNMPFDRKMKARTVIALMCLSFVFFAGELSLIAVLVGVALLMACLIVFELLFCETAFKKHFDVI